MSRPPRRLLALMVGAAALSGQATAQILPGVLPALPGVPALGGVLNGGILGGGTQGGGGGQVARTLDTLGVPDGLAGLDTRSLLDLRRLRLKQLVRDHPRQLDMDDQGNPVRKGELLVIDPDDAMLAAAKRARFILLQEHSDAELGMRTVVLAPPDGLSIKEALKRLRTAAPGINADYNHVFEPAGAMLAPDDAPAASRIGRADGRRIAMIDGGVGRHPAFAGASIEQRAFSGGAKATGHGTAVASLLVGDNGAFRGAARGAQLYVADVYGGDQSAGSAAAIVRALAWAASKQPDVINISLVGPPNRLLQRAVDALARRGIPLVAAVGNDGPAAPPQYPASYPDVIAVTAVDGRDRALPEAGRSPQLDFAAPGADMAAALLGGTYSRVRGTSFAAPLVAARIAIAGDVGRLAGEAVKGRGKVGRGILCRSCRVEPKLVGANKIGSPDEARTRHRLP